MPSSSTTTVTSSRAYDHIYDPVYTVSDGRDHSRAHVAATAGRNERVPDHANMFSEIPLYPNHSYRMTKKEELPAHVNQSYRGSSSNVEASAPQANLDHMIEGANRYRYFRRPIVPYLEAVPPEILLADSSDVNNMIGNNNYMASNDNYNIIDGKRSIGIQTMYRDSEAQTDAYTPDYTVRPGEEPEVLTLASLNHENGLPAGLGQVEMIERARAKRLFEASLPPMTDEANLDLRKRMVSEQEMSEWTARESEIDKLQAERLELLQDAIEQRDKESEFLTEQRVETLRQHKLEEKDTQVAIIQRKRIKALRKLSKARKSVDPKPSKRDIISEYALYSSEVYAPTNISGKHPDNRSRSFEVSPADTRSIEGLANLEQTLPHNLLMATTIRPDVTLDKSAAGRKDKIVASHLEKMDMLLKIHKNADKIEKPPTPPPAWKRKVERIVRPPTPDVTSSDEALDDYTNAVILIQKLLRGRAVQNRMFEGKDKRFELIRELRISEPLAAAKNELAAVDAKDDTDRNQTETIQASIDGLHAEVISALLDYTSKHLIRLKAERRISAVVQRAETERRTRESTEGERRQAESIVREREEIIYKQIMHTHQTTVASFLDSIITDSIDNTASMQARNEMDIRESSNSATISSIEEGDENDRMIVKELIGSFLMPEVDRIKVQNDVMREETRFVNAARASLEDVEMTVMKEMK